MLEAVRGGLPFRETRCELGLASGLTTGWKLNDENSLPKCCLELRSELGRIASTTRLLRRVALNRQREPYQSSPAAHWSLRASFLIPCAFRMLGRVRGGPDLGADAQGGHAVAAYAKQHGQPSIESTLDEFDQGHWWSAFRHADLSPHK